MTYAGSSQWGVAARQVKGIAGSHIARAPSAQNENRAQQPGAAQSQSFSSMNTAWHSDIASHPSTVS
jgi:hypothetical protein